MKRILLVDDDVNLRRVIEYNLTQQGYEVVVASNGEEALKHFSAAPFHLVVTDIRMPGMDGTALLHELKRRSPSILVIVITAYGTIENAVRAMKAGAYDYITKPFNREELNLVVKKALDYQGLLEENIALHQQLEEKFRFENIIGASAKMQAIFKQMARIKDSDATVLIRGESGTGKELVAKALHYNGKRRNERFVPVNCSAIPSELLESELFGHVKGAFTGAIADHEGKFATANKGTIFLDEIGDMSPALQSKLLRVLQEREIERVGTTRPVPVDVRVIAATHTNLEQKLKQGEFREDLYYRLNVIPLVLPPLRERPEDIPLLVQHFVKKLGAGHLTISPDVLRTLQSARWPGNVRELENFFERIVLMRESQTNVVTLEDLPADFARVPSTTLPLNLSIPEEGIALEELEKALIVRALEQSQYNQSRAAKLLGITRQTLIYRLKKYKIRVPSAH